MQPTETGAHRIPENTSVDYQRLSPKLGVIFTAAPALSLFASYREGFRAPAQDQLFQQNTAANTVDLKPVVTRSYEAGLRGRIGDRLVYQISAYDMRLTDDILTLLVTDGSSASRIAANAGQTRHRGVEGSLGIAVAPTLHLDASYAVARHRYEQWVVATGTRSSDFSGNRMESAPEDMASLLVSWSPALLGGGRVAAEWSSIGRFWMDPENTRRYPGYSIVNFYYNQHFGRGAEMFARVSNLLNERYAVNATFDQFQGARYTPGAPRTIYAGLRYAWER